MDLHTGIFWLCNTYLPDLSSHPSMLLVDLFVLCLPPLCTYTRVFVFFWLRVFDVFVTWLFEEIAPLLPHSYLGVHTRARPARMSPSTDMAFNSYKYDQTTHTAKMYIRKDKLYLLSAMTVAATGPPTVMCTCDPKAQTRGSTVTHIFS